MTQTKKSSLILKRLIFVAVFILGFTALEVFAYNYTHRGEKKEETPLELRTDKKPILDRFPKLGNFEKCYWQTDALDHSKGLSVGPTAYWMKGYVFLDSNTLKDFKENYTWSAADSSWKPSFETEAVNDKAYKWVYSEEFNKYIMSDSYFGQFYLDIESGIIYFEIQR